MTNQHVNQMGADMAIQLMLMVLFGILADEADDADKFRADVRKQLSNIADTIKLPSVPTEVDRDVRGAAKTVIASVLARTGATH